VCGLRHGLNVVQKSRSKRSFGDGQPALAATEPKT
jgi:hypothetical protein